jgi:glucan biosynthesis protein C
MNRLIYLDNLRSFALLLGLVFHTAIVYSSGVGYTIKSTETSEIYKWFVLWVHTFRMPLFFFLSGYFSELVLSRKGQTSYLHSRLSRVVLPGLVGLFLFAPVDGYFRSESSFLFMPSYPMHLVTFFIGENFTLSHIWFLYYLALYSIMYVAIRKIFLKLPIIQNQFVLKSIIFFLTFFAIMIPNLFFTREDFFLEIRPMFYLFYFTFFAIGAYVYNHQLLEQLIPSPKSILYFLVLLGIGFGVYMILEEVDQYWMVFLHDSKRVQWRVLHLLLETFLAWGFSLTALSLFKKYGNTETPLSKELIHSLLPIYLVHHPVSIYLGYLFSDGNLPRDIAFFVHLSLVFIISFSFYSLVKKFRIMSFLMGIQYEPKTPEVRIAKT